ncbi:DUF6519 domain-containing protein [Brasilonema sp. UFV-L1]|uniref:DUF6519 domain-containing protein n=1 Tax=Brasilonema sp. UFV-L1 TaxID=2234130 RepID=UPI00145C60C6|nr:DUF6519 domain-containing protein [Brasilonema sp. UFV-L1]NMG08782.1 hypothetical protein [Brasilonema sp. UFV-L1]
MQGDFSRYTFDPKKHYSAVLMQQGRVQVDADWNEQQFIHQYRIETETQDVIGKCGTPKHDAGFEITITDNQLSISKGRFYVHGILCENHEKLLYTKQPNLPNSADDIIKLLSDAKTDIGIVYLDVWQRHITALNDQRIREVALGGADTATRAKTVWQVKFLPVKHPISEQLSCQTQLTEWDKLIASSTGKLNAQTKPIEDPKNPCLIPPTAGYQRLENQLYRVEIHYGSDHPNGVTFKWSRENGSVVTAIEKINGQNLIVANVGKDEVLGFAPGQWVEVINDELELNGKPGQLLQIIKLDAATRVIELSVIPSLFDSSQPNSGVNLQLHPKLRRWEQQGITATVDGVKITNNWMQLEGGIEVKFDSGTYKTGDYWLIPARTATGQIEWFIDNSTLSLSPIPQLPLGIKHHYCRLALVQLELETETLKVITDCRPIFPPLTELPKTGGCCTVTVADGVQSQGDFTRIEDAIAYVLGERKENTWVKICILPGVYKIAEPIVINSGSHLIISGCDRQAYIQGQNNQPVFQLNSCNNIIFESLWIEVDSQLGSIWATESDNITVTGCQFVNQNQSAFCNLCIQAENLQLLKNRLLGGGLWICDGSANILIHDNDISQGAGAGIILGKLPQQVNPSKRSTGILGIEIIGNRISKMSNSGISTVDNLEGTEKINFGDITNITIAHNHIVECAAKGVNPLFDSLTVGGIILREVSQVRIQNNYIADNGVQRNDNGVKENVRACGIFVFQCFELEVTNNTIVNNGSSAQQEDNTTLQAGIVGWVVLAGKSQTPNVERLARVQAAAPAAFIHNNIVVTPAGQALILFGAGSMSVIGNTLTSQGLVQQPESLNLNLVNIFGRCVFIFNLGQDPFLVNTALSYQLNNNFAVSNTTFGRIAIAQPRRVTDGRVMFHDNQVTLQELQTVSQPIWTTVFIYSLDDISLQNNQILIEILGNVQINQNRVPPLLINVLTLAPTIRASGNRFNELPQQALWSYLSIGLINLATNNQATHCLTIQGTIQPTSELNQIIINTFCPRINTITTSGG